MNGRFLVPVIGKISAGKSSFLNALLGEKILQDGTKPTTQFMCIIRHNPDSKTPILYKISTNNTGPPNSLHQISVHYSENQSTFPSFEKGEEEARGLKEIKLKIEDINRKMKNKIKNGEQINENDMFYILEVKINLFDEFNINPLFTDSFDFVDVPGLNESNTLDGNDNFKFIDYINKKSEQIGFYIFIIDHYSLDNDVADIINKLKNKDTNNLIVITKIDQHNAHSTNKQLAEKLGINQLKDNVSYVYSFLIRALSSYLKTKSISDFANVLYYSFQYYRSPEIAEIAQNLKFISFCIKEYQSFQKECVEVENNNIDNNSSIDEFFVAKEDNEIKKNKDEIKEKVILLMKDYGSHYIEKTKESLKDLIGNLKDCFQKNLKRKMDFDSYAKMCLSILDEINEMAKSINNKENEFIKINIEDHKQVMNDLYYNQRIRIPLLGGYNVGKSILLNAIIGQDILPVSSSECTQKGIIIRYSEQKDSALYRMKIENEYICETSDPPIAKGNCQVIKKAIDKLNNDINNKQNFFYLLTTKIEFFENYSINHEIRELIEFIDFPGLNTKINSPKNDNFYTLIKSSKSFLYINNQDLINERGNLLILNTLFERISFIKSIDTSTFYKCCIFVLNKVDEPKLINIDKAIATFKSLFSDRNSERENVKQLMNHAKVVTFSSKNYSDLIKDFIIWTNLENTLNHLYEYYRINVLDCQLEQSFIDFCLKTIEDKCQDLKIETNVNIKQTIIAQTQDIRFKDMIRSFDVPNPDLLKATNDDINTFLQLFNLVKKHYSNQKLLINSISQLFSALTGTITDIYTKYKDIKEKLIQERIKKLSDLIKDIIDKIDNPKKKDNKKIEDLRQLLKEDHFDENTQKAIHQLEEIYKEISQENKISDDELKKKYKCKLLVNVPEEMRKKYSNKIKEILTNYKEIQEEEIKKHNVYLERYITINVINDIIKKVVLTEAVVEAGILGVGLGAAYLGDGAISLGILSVAEAAANFIYLANFALAGLALGYIIGSSLWKIFNDGEIRKHLEEVVNGIQNNCKDAVGKLMDINKKLEAIYKQPFKEELKKEEEDYSRYKEREKQNMLRIQKKVEELQKIMIRFLED